MDPTDARRRGTRRVRLVTAAVAGGALVGTGALTVVVADAHPAAAESATTTATDPGTSTGDGGRLSGPPGGVGAGHGGSSHASSGSS
ncbi:hypothetical protein [Klenkia taihuensis]|uniref:Uncharacterized protein n=1 Tax=Klenkia taihuensis TaxID=1225127 RepID=A0A1I1IU36_9ACTN|nr:hypothetical protein [Klenkia taihuensis]GHE11262.1 hypothetical protein GCM10011381_24060 [Klenkia taihuensis]SFC39819.1 hypothetical protein SAMN05661030_0867 [Klenkia taihuensis]